MSRSTVMLVALLLVLGGIAYFLLPSEQVEREASYTAAVPVIHIDSASVVKVELRRPRASVTIENIGGKWTVTAPVRFPADPAGVFQLIGGLSRFTPGSLVSSNPDKQHLFQVDSAGTRVTVSMRTGAPVSFIIGKTGPSYADVYFRLPDAREVFLGSGLESWTYTKEVREWRDRGILMMPADAVKKLTYSAQGKEVSASRDSAGWRSSDPAVESGTFATAASAVAGLRADDFADSLKSFPANRTTVVIGGPPDVTLRFAPVPPDSARYYLQSSTSDQTYLVSKWSADQILKPVAKPAKKGSAVAAAPPPVRERPAPKPAAPIVEKVKKETPKPEQKSAAAQTPPQTPPQRNPLRKGGKAQAQEKTQPSPQSQTPPAGGESAKPAPKESAPTEQAKPKETKSATPAVADDEGELSVHTVKRGETMQTIAKKYNVTVEQVLRWNLLKSIVVKPGQELYIYEKK